MDGEYIVQFIKHPRNKYRNYNNKYRVVNTSGTEENHTHLNNIGVCKKVIELTKNKKLPLTAKKYLIKSCYRLSTDKDYKAKVNSLYEEKINKNKQKYVNKNNCK